MKLGCKQKIYAVLVCCGICSMIHSGVFATDDLSIGAGSTSTTDSITDSAVQSSERSIPDATYSNTKEKGNAIDVETDDYTAEVAATVFLVTFCALQ